MQLQMKILKPTTQYSNKVMLRKSTAAEASIR